MDNKKVGLSDTTKAKTEPKPSEGTRLLEQSLQLQSQVQKEELESQHLPRISLWH